MKENTGRVSLGHLLFAAILLISLGMRLSHLGAWPLDDGEARQALWAAEGTPEDSVFWPQDDGSGSSAAYQSATWAVFQLAGGREASARLFPAVIGALIVLPPWLLRRRLGQAGALTASFLLATSPTLVATSRTADGASAAMLAVALGVTALIQALDEEWSSRRAMALLAVCIALGLASGPAFFLGMLGFVPAVGLMLATSPRVWSGGEWGRIRTKLPTAIGIGLLGAVVVAVAAGLLPRGLATLAEGLRVWLLGWIGPGSMHSLTPMMMLFAYEPLLVVFGVVGIVIAVKTRDSLGIGASWWAGLALLVAVLYPARSGPAIAWCTIPLAVLSGSSLAGEAERWRRLPSPWQAFGVAALVSLLLVYAGVQLSAHASGIGPGASPLVPEARLAVAAGAILVAILAVILIGLGWSWSVARSGVAAAGAFLLLLLSLSSGWRLNFFRQRLGGGELWTVSTPTYGIPRIAATLASLSTTARGVADDLPIAVAAQTPPPSLVWALRAFPRFTTSDSAGAESPPVILRPSGLEPQLRADYLGQSVVIAETWDFPGPLPPAALQWWWRRRVPVLEDTWLLLVRADIATLGEAGSGEVLP
jgi:hypothetical protein